MSEELKGVVAEKHKVSIAEVNRVLDSSYGFMRKKIQELDLVCDPDELEDLRTNFNMPGLFKLYVNPNVHKRINRDKFNKNKKVKDEEES